MILHYLHHIYRLFVFGCCFPFCMFSQSRNENVRRLNDVVSMMDEASRLNYTWYNDAVQLAKALEHSKDKINPNYFYSSRNTHAGTVSYTGMEKALRFKELKPDSNGRLPSYMADLIPWLEAKEQVLGILYKPHKSIASLDSLVWSYIHCTDSLHLAHNSLSDYISAKTYTNDPGFAKAKIILQQQEHWFDACHNSSQALAIAMQKLYTHTFPPDKSHAALQQAEQEMRLSLSLLDNWEKSLYKGDFSKNKSYDSLLRQLNQTALGRDSMYLYQTRGYGKRNSGWWAHSRYRSFYKMLQSTVYWYATARYSNYPYLKPEFVRYNQFINGYDNAMEYYNRFIEIADGKTMTVQSSCCLSPSEIDTAQNVMLKHPRLLYRFAYVDPDHAPESTDPLLPPGNTPNTDAERIGKALPHHLVYLLDASSSMNEPERLPALKLQVKYLVKLQRASDRISLISFASHAHTILKDQPCNQNADLYEKIEQLSAMGSTNISEGLSKAAQLADSCHLRKGITKILLFTDGAFSLSRADKKVLQSLASLNIGFCIVYLGRTKKSTEDTLRKICEIAGGRYYSVNTSNLKEVLVKEASE